jgi:translation initiation factor 2 subunit 3
MDLNKIILKQPIVNLGIIGHVSNGKSSVTKCLTGIATQKYSDEKKRNITIRLGYANCKIFKCPECPEPQCYKSTGEPVDIMMCSDCEIEMELVNHISICDVPGHNLFMSAMMNGTSVMDYTILVESAINSELPAPQTTEHLVCTNLSKIPNVATCLNKLDLVKKSDAITIMKKLKSEFKDTQAEKSLMIPVSASLGLNIDALLQILANLKPVDKKYDTKSVMFVVRSFNINKCGTEINELRGGVLGGSIISGTLSINDDVIIKPGYITKATDGISKYKYKPIISKVLSINSEKTELESAISGGLIGVQLDIDPGLTANDGLIGCIVLDKSLDTGEYKVFEEIKLQLEKFRDDDDEVELNVGDIMLISVNSSNCKSKIIRVNEHQINLELLDKPVCTKVGDYCTISSYKNDVIKIIGRGTILDGKESQIF